MGLQKGSSILLCYWCWLYSGILGGSELNGYAPPGQIGFQGELFPVFFQPCSAGLVLRHHRGHHGPELLGMIHVSQMAELMDHHIVQHNGGCEDQSIVKRETAAGRTATPAGLLVPDGDGAVMSAGDLVVVSHTVLKLCPCLGSVALSQGYQASSFRSRQRGVFVLCQN